MINNNIILTTTSSFSQDCPALLNRLRELNLQAVINPLGRTLNETELINFLRAYRPIGLLAGTEPISRRALDEAKSHLRVVSRVGSGWDNIDRGAANEFGILLYRTPGVLTQAVAELTVGLILSALRMIRFHDSLIRQGLWNKHMGGLLQNKIVGLIGFGSIGQRVGDLVRAFGANVIYYDPEIVSHPWAKRVDFQQLLESADIISLHASGNELILGEKEFKSVGKSCAILVNTARGCLIDEEALYVWLADRNRAYACLDVFSKEPYRGPLCIMDNVILTPHIGSYAREARLLMEETALNNLLTGLKEAGILK